MEGRFLQTLEYRRDPLSRAAIAGSFFADIGFLMSLLLGFRGLAVKDGAIEDWPKHSVVLPEGWDAIEVDQLWIRGRPARLSPGKASRARSLQFH
jgi:hypothetical protein